MTCRLWTMFNCDDPKVLTYVLFSHLCCFPFLNKLITNTSLILESLILLLKLWQLHVYRGIMSTWTGISLGNRYDCITACRLVGFMLHHAYIRITEIMMHRSISQLRGKNTNMENIHVVHEFWIVCFICLFFNGISWPYFSLSHSWHKKKWHLPDLWVITIIILQCCINSRFAL